MNTANIPLDSIVPDDIVGMMYSQTLKTLKRGKREQFQANER